MEQDKKSITLIIIALKNGDEGAFKSVYNSQKNGLRAFINSFTKDLEQADDILQDTFIKFWNARRTLNLDTVISTYLRKIAYNLYIDLYRKKKREELMLDGWLYKRLNNLISEDEDINRKKIKLVRAAIEKLPPRCKEIFVLSKFDHKKYAEIAEQMNISIKTVEVQMGIAFNIIRKEVRRGGIVNLFLSLFRKKLCAI